MTEIIKRALLATTAILSLAMLFVAPVAPARVSAASADPVDTARKHSLEDLCTALADISSTSSLYRLNCGHAWTVQHLYDRAYENICDVHGPLTRDHKLKTECNDYFALIPTPPSVDPAACAADNSQPGCSEAGVTGCSAGACDLIKKYVNPGINLVSAMFALIAVISLILGGIQYASSAGDAQKVTAAKKRISNTIYAVIAYAFLFAFLQFLVPGGLFRG